VVEDHSHYEGEPNAQDTVHVKDDVDVHGIADGGTERLQTQCDMDFKALIKAYKTPLYLGAKLSYLVAILLLLHLFRTHGCSEFMMDEMLLLMKKSILPDMNTLPQAAYEANKYLKCLGLSFNIIHVCPNSCMLFRGAYNNLKACLKCGASRFRQSRSKGVPTKVMWHFPLIPRLKRMFSTPALAKLMRWQPQNKSMDNKLRYVVDSKQWIFIDKEFFTEFAYDKRNLRLGLATNGMNTFLEKRSTWSTWPTLILNYNLPPWLIIIMKKHFVALSQIIVGKRASPMSILMFSLKLYWRSLNSAAHKVFMSWIALARLRRWNSL
jgi:hypothetical protein